MRQHKAVVALAVHMLYMTCVCVCPAAGIDAADGMGLRQIKRKHAPRMNAYPLLAPEIEKARKSHSDRRLLTLLRILR